MRRASDLTRSRSASLISLGGPRQTRPHHPHCPPLRDERLQALSRKAIPGALAQTSWRGSERKRTVDEASGRVVRRARSSVLPPGKRYPGMPPERVKAIADDFLKSPDISDRSNLHVEIGPDLPHFFGAGVDLGSPNASGSFLPAIAGADPATDRGRNVVGLVASAFPAETAGGRAAVERTLRHKILAHYGINILPPDKKRALLDHLIASRNMPELRGLARAMDRDYTDRSADARAEELQTGAGLAADSSAASTRRGSSLPLKKIAGPGMSRKSSAPTFSRSETATIKSGMAARRSLSSLRRK